MALNCCVLSFTCLSLISSTSCHHVVVADVGVLMPLLVFMWCRHYCRIWYGSNNRKPIIIPFGPPSSHTMEEPSRTIMTLTPLLTAVRRSWGPSVLQKYCPCGRAMAGSLTLIQIGRRHQLKL